MTDGKINIVVVDDHPLFREGVVRTLSADDRFEVVAEGGSADEALELAQEYLPDIMLLDVSMPGGGIQAAQRVASACPICKVVMLTVAEDEEVVYSALKAGARGYVLKGVSGTDLTRILYNIQAGDAYITPSLATTLLVDMKNRDAPASAPSGTDRLDDLTPRERDILEELSRGASNKQIAATLSLSEKTVKHHMTNILQKLHVRNRVEAALIAQRAATRGT